MDRTVYYNIILQYFNLMGPPLYMWSVAERNLVMRRRTVKRILL